MHIRYGYDIALELAQPATILSMTDVHSEIRCCIVEETELEDITTIGQAFDLISSKL